MAKNKEIKPLPTYKWKHPMTDVDLSKKEEEPTWLERVLTYDLLKQIAPYAPKNAEVYIPHLIETCNLFEINTPLRLSMFLAQLAKESDQFKTLQEYASGKAYDTGRKAKMLGNTPEADGDGQLYKGRGGIQVTGKDNYRRCSLALFGDDRLLKHPELLATPRLGMIASGWYWSDKKLNKYADTKQITKCSKIINGGYNGLGERKAYYFKARKILLAA